MPSASLTRRVSFAAAHRYSRPEWSEEKNVATFGPCAWPNYHGHTYVCEVTVSGPIDDATGFVVDLGERGTGRRRRWVPWREDRS